MALLTEQTSTFESKIFYSSYLGLIVGWTLLSIISIHILFQYYLLFCRQKSERNKCIHILVLSFCINSIIAGFILGFVRSNWFLSVSPSQFTHTQCLIGYTLFYGFAYTIQAILYITFIYRIHLIFRSSIYDYYPHTYRIIYSLIIINWIILSGNIIVRGVGYTSFVVYYTDSDGSGFAVCSSRDSLAGPATILSTTMNVFIHGILLYMFIRGLWSLHKILLKDYMERQMPKIEHLKPPMEMNACPSDSQQDQNDGSNITSSATVKPTLNQTMKVVV